ncbi:MAG: transcriptional regulator NrdR [Chthoniobacterales bacterium]
MRCPRCGDMSDRVIDSRVIQDGERIRRRRQCVACGTRYTTYEEVEQVELRVLKRGGRIEPFHRYKLLSSLSKACETRPIKLETLERLVDEIVTELGAETGREVPSRLIGLRAMEKLQAIDPVAYVRYASIYRQFQEAGEFVDEVEQMKKRTPRRADQPELFNVPPKAPAVPA